MSGNIISPMKTFYFTVQIGTQIGPIQFQEVSGLVQENLAEEFREGTTTLKNIPRTLKTANVTCKRGVFTKDKIFRDWYNSIGLQTIKTTTVTIHLIDDSGTPVMVWTLSNAWPVKTYAADLNPNDNDITIDYIEFAFDTMTTASSL